MFIAPMIWYGTTVGVRNTLLPQLFSQIDPVHEVWAYGILGAVATLVSAITNLLFGALSDVTRSRWGKRRPYIVWGTIVMALSLIVVANLKSGVAIIIVWIVDATAENAMPHQFTHRFLIGLPRNSGERFPPSMALVSPFHTKALPF